MRRSLSSAALLPLVAAVACGDPVAPGPDPAPELEVVEGSGQVGVPGQLLAGPLAFRLVDGDGAPVPGATLSFFPVPADGNASPTRARTDSAGLATTRWRLAGAEGSQVLEVRSNGAGDPVQAAATALPFPAVDAVVAAGVESDQPLGVLVDGRSSIGPSDDFRFVDRGPTVGIGDWRGDGQAGELTVFAPGGAVRHRASPGFTEGPDTVRFGPEEPADIDLTVWLVAGPTATGRVESALITAARIFDEEGLGVRIRSVEWREVGDVPADLLSFTCQSRAALRDSVGQDEGRIDVYVVSTVDGSDSRGQACRIGGDFVALAAFAGPTLLAHELGHNLGLLHVDHLGAHFDVTNMMHSASDTRDGLSEGQIFRAQLNAVSVINELYGHREPALLRACYYGSSPECPPTELRLWRDGPFGPWPAAGPGAGPGGDGGAAAGPAPPGHPETPAGPGTSTEPGVESAVGPVEAVLEDCGLHGAPTPGDDGRGEADRTGVGAPGARGAVDMDPSTVRRLLEEGPPADVVARSRQGAARRARANLRWLAARGRPGWLVRVPAEAIDPGAAADAAETRLRASWRTELEKLR